MSLFAKSLVVKAFRKELVVKGRVAKGCVTKSHVEKDATTTARRAK